MPTFNKLFQRTEKEGILSSLFVEGRIIWIPKLDKNVTPTTQNKERKKEIYTAISFMTTNGKTLNRLANQVLQFMTQSPSWVFSRNTVSLTFEKQPMFFTRLIE